MNGLSLLEGTCSENGYIPVQKDYSEKIEIIGNIVRTYSYEKPIVINRRPSNNESLADKPTLSDKQKEENRKKSERRAKTKVIRKVNSNWGNTQRGFLPGRKTVKFLTLTYAENMQDYDRLTADWGLFVKRLEYHLGEKIQYLCVHERQKRGAFHIHALVESSYIPLSVLKEMWYEKPSKGTFDIKRVNHVGNMGNYIAKYMTKGSVVNNSADSVDMFNKKRYWNSKGLKDLTVDIKMEKDELPAMNAIRDCLRNESIYTIEREFDTEWLGKVKFVEFSLPPAYQTEKLLKEKIFELARLTM